MVQAGGTRASSSTGVGIVLRSGLYDRRFLGTFEGLQKYADLVLVFLQDYFLGLGEGSTDLVHLHYV